MKKLLYFAVSFLSLAIIFAAGWASGVGTLKNKQEQPVGLSKDLNDDEKPANPDDSECPECPRNDEKPNFHRFYGYRLRLPVPPEERDRLRIPKKASWQKAPHPRGFIIICFCYSL